MLTLRRSVRRWKRGIITLRAPGQRVEKYITGPLITQAPGASADNLKAHTMTNTNGDRDNDLGSSQTNFVYSSCKQYEQLKAECSLPMRGLTGWRKGKTAIQDQLRPT